MKKKILICWGTRPEAIKLAPLAIAMKRHPKLQPVILESGQHVELLRPVTRLFKLRPDYDLRAMTPDQTLAGLSERILSRVAPLLKKVRPDCVLIQGDTSTAFLIALAAFYEKIPVGHVEAGLRTDDKYQPFPEEINRRLITQVADFHFAPTEIAAKRLARAGVEKRAILMTGNTGIDALFMMKRALEERKEPPLAVPASGKIILVTAHRRESFGKPFESLCRGILAVARAVPEGRIYYPVHLNPNVKRTAQKMLAGHPRIRLLAPLAYDQLVYLLMRADVILTDSGGIQEEAPSFHKPIVVLRNVTERPEGVRAGFSFVAGQDPARILRMTLRCLEDRSLRARLGRKKNPYGDGRASSRILRFLAARL
ncbi:MAG: non-hydrolyzing UDP-N-acetylglucosamine 2-epimerase [Candidatus Omnitrophota bacterium]